MTTEPPAAPPSAPSAPKDASSEPSLPPDPRLAHLPRDPRLSHPSWPLPRIIVYHQTHFANTEQGPQQHISLLPLLSESPIAVTHVILAAIHLNDQPGDITLNDDPYRAPKNDVVWAEARTLRSHGIKVMGMLGGAAQGSYRRLDQDDAREFQRFYTPLRDMVRWAALDGLDLDVEEHMSLAGVVRLVLQLRRDFGPRFVITLAPVATALQERPPGLLGLDAQSLVSMMAGHKRHTNLSGFSYRELEKAVGPEIDWYNAQFYCGWGNAESTVGYDRIVAPLQPVEKGDEKGAGWAPERVVLGLITNPEKGQGWVEDEVLYETLLVLTAKYEGFAGVMGWEYFESITAQEPFGWPWSWARLMTRILRPDVEEKGKSDQAST
ncbi:hypothetical protein FH972_023360 [Carpinus fangiana]|uniref:chitinase n=1 Tax=Carpinus fangiana TaxID=176857 RepID=A0A5N6KUZ7_9ROSI|nr:hypothetical protein FH972_023360 [Carpinus fangiana]